MVLGAFLLSVLAALAYYQIFSEHASYDDEGYMMLAVRHFLAGHPLYDEVWTLYGPVYFFYKWLIHGLCGLPLTHDVVRLTATAVRLLTSILAAVSAFGLTGSLTLAALAQMLVTFHLATIVREPGHPQELCGLLTMAIVAIPSVARRQRPMRMLIAVGLLVAALSMVKVNLGIFAGLGVWMSLLSLVPSTAVSVALRIVSSAALVALPLLFARSVPYFAATEAMSIVAVCTIALTRRNGSSRIGDLVAFASAWAGGVVLVGLVTLAKGTTMAALLDCLIVAPSHMPALFAGRLLEYYSSPLVAAAAVALAVVVRATEGSRASPHVVGFAKLAFAVAALTASDVSLLIGRLTPFLWLPLLAPAETQEDASRRLARLILCWVAVLQPLQAFPVAGSQLFFGTVVHLVVGVVCLADGMRWLRSLSGMLGRRELRASAAGVLLVAVMSYSVWQLRAVRQGYAALVPVNLPGTVRLRLPMKTVRMLQTLTQTLRERADTFLCVPGFNSLYFWTGKEPPTLDVIGQDMRFYSDERQAAMVSALLQNRSPMVVHFPGMAGPYPPFEERLRQSFKPLMQIGPYELLVPR
jgi:hypothetical protein